MPERSESTLLTRLNRLEIGVKRVNRAVAAGLILLLAIGLLGSAGTVQGTAPSLEAQEFVLRDGEGRLRGRLTVRDGEAVLVLRDEAGKVTAELGGGARVFPAAQ